MCICVCTSVCVAFMYICVCICILLHLVCTCVCVAQLLFVIIPLLKCWRRCNECIFVFFQYSIQCYKENKNASSRIRSARLKSGLSWSVLVCPGLPLSVLVCPCLSWSGLACPGLSWSVLVCLTNEKLTGWLLRMWYLISWTLCFPKLLHFWVFRHFVFVFVFVFRITIW